MGWVLRVESHQQAVVISSRSSFTHIVKHLLHPVDSLATFHFSTRISRNSSSYAAVVYSVKMPATTRSKQSKACQECKGWTSLQLDVRLYILDVYLDEIIAALDDYASRRIGWADIQLDEIGVLAGIGNKAEVIAAVERGIASLTKPLKRTEAAIDELNRQYGEPLTWFQSYPSSRCRTRASMTSCGRSSTT